MRTHRAVVVGAAVVTVLLVGACSSSGSGVSTGSSSTTAGTYAAPYVRGGEFSLLTYNVAGLPQEISQQKPGINIPLISPLLDAYDLVLTQEDFDWWGPLASRFDFVNYHDRLRAKASQKYRSARHPGPEAVGLDTSKRPVPEVGDGLGVLSKFEIDGNARVPWTGCYGGFDVSDGGQADCLAMKGLLMTKVTLAKGAVVDVYDVALETGDTNTDGQLRSQDLDELAVYIVEHSANSPVIVAGDFGKAMSGDQGSAWAGFLEKTGLTDACAAAQCADGSLRDKVAFRSGTGVSLGALRHTVQADRFVDGSGEPLSYHDPVEVRFRWSRT